jgi:hypothetical protein
MMKQFATWKCGIPIVLFQGAQLHHVNIFIMFGSNVAAFINI